MSIACDGFIDNLESTGWMGNAILVNNSDNDEDCDGYKIDDDRMIQPI